jgi:predicted CopG family antitoxin
MERTPCRSKLTITIVAEIYGGLHRVIGRGKISGFIENLVRPHVVRHELASAYKAMTEEEDREREALEWSEATCGDSAQY